MTLIPGGQDPSVPDEIASLVVVVPSKADDGSFADERAALWFLASVARLVQAFGETEDRTLAVTFAVPRAAAFPVSAFAATICLESHGDANVSVVSTDGPDDAVYVDFVVAEMVRLGAEALAFCPGAPGAGRRCV